RNSRWSSAVCFSGADRSVRAGQPRQRRSCRRRAGARYHQNCSNDRWVQTTLSRSSLWAIQTPQVFRKQWIVEAHDRAAREAFEATDDAMLVERIGKPVFVVDGESTNIKITTPEDVWFAEALLRQKRIP